MTFDIDSDNPSEHAVACPFCGSLKTEVMSLFGQQLLTLQFYCNDCRTPFEKIKDDAAIHIVRENDRRRC